MPTPIEFFLHTESVDPLAGGLTALTVLIAVYVLSHVAAHILDNAKEAA